MGHDGTVLWARDYETAALYYYKNILINLFQYHLPTPETTIDVVGCNLLCPAVNVKADVKASYGLSVSL